MQHVAIKVRGVLTFRPKRIAHLPVKIIQECCHAAVTKPIHFAGANDIEME